MTIRDGSGNVEIIKTTDEHQFWVEGKGWTAAAELDRGFALDQPDGSDAFVISSVREAHPEGIAVFNFEVEGDHTYFIEDGQSSRVAAVWVHNVCSGDAFVARGPKGRISKFESATEVTWTRATSQQKQLVDDEYNGVIRDASGVFQGINAWNSGRSNFLRHLAHDEKSVAQLQAAGFSPSQIKAMKGVEIGQNPVDWIPPKLPSGWEVHHKTPREAGGSNDFGNLVIIRKEQHSALSREEGLLFGDVEVGKQKSFEFPMFEGQIIHDNW